MDAIEPILPNPSILPGVQAAQRSAPIHRDGGGHGGQDRRQRRQPRDEEAVEVDVAGATDLTSDDEDAVILGLSSPRVDLMMGAPAAAGPEEPPRQVGPGVDGRAEPPLGPARPGLDGRAEPPARRIDLSA